MVVIVHGNDQLHVYKVIFRCKLKATLWHLCLPQIIAYIISCATIISGTT